MIVATFFSNVLAVLNEFEDFIYSYPMLRLDYKDEDTAYFINCTTGSYEIYYHYILNDLKYEFSYNYSKVEQQKIRSYFGPDEFYFFDIQFKDQEFFDRLLRDFNIFLVKKRIYHDKVLVSHPRDGKMVFYDARDYKVY